MAEILKNTGAKLWSMVDDHDELQSNVFDQLFGTGGKSDIRLIDEAIGKINESLNGYYFKIINDKLYICKDTESGTTSLPLSITDDDGHVALKVDGTSITIDGNGVVHGATIDDAFSLTSENAVQNKVVKAKFDEVDQKINANETTISSHTTALETLNGEGEGSVKKTVTDEIAKVVADAPESLDTLKEISDWISSHESDASAMNSAIQANKSDIATLQTDKVDKETGKSLLADTDKVNYDDAVSKAHSHTNKSVLDGITNDKISSWDNKSDFSGSYNDLIDKPIVDTKLSDTSTNPVQNKVIKKYVDEKQVNIDGITLTLDEARNVIKLADALKDKIGSALQPESIVNNQTTTEAGFALDARQANPNVDGTLAKQISDLNGSLNYISTKGEAYLRSLDGIISLSIYDDNLYIKYTKDESKDYYAELAIGTHGMSLLKNDSSGYNMKQIVNFQ